MLARTELRKEASGAPSNHCCCSVSRLNVHFVGLFLPPLPCLPRSSAIMGGLSSGGKPDLDSWLEKLRGCNCLEEDELKVLCEHVRQHAACRAPNVHASSLASPLSTSITMQVIEILVEESNVQPVNSPVTVRSCPELALKMGKRCTSGVPPLEHTRADACMLI